MAQLSFNASKAAPMEDRSFDLVPEGEYLAQIIKSEIKPNSKGTAERLNMQAKILGGDSKGSILFIGLNWGHPNQVAQDISDREFKSICDAVGKGNDEIADTEELHGVPFIATVKHSKPSGNTEVVNGETVYQYGPKAEIKKYESAEGHPLATGNDEAPAAPEGSKEGGSPPWSSKNAA